MEYFKLQLGCLIIAVYITFIYSRERKAYKVKKDRLFAALSAVGIICIVFDGVTAYTVNHLDKISEGFNLLLHMCFLLSIDFIVFMMFIYMMDITIGFPRSKILKAVVFLPLLLNIILVVRFIPELEYIEGRITNYSMGTSVYTCFIMVIMYFIMALVIALHSWRNLERHKQISISTYFVATGVVCAYQMIRPEALITSLVPTIVVLGAYLNQENPVFTRINKYHKEMVMGFATLVENRDDSTGGHILRTTGYVEILAEALKKQGYYREQLTEDYIRELAMAAPMHDIGKIAIPDAILQKPGRLTQEEFAVMKTHAERGGKIIQETFGHLGEDSYEIMAYQVARYHHEKWNGKGYPDGLSGSQIPLCARIMSIADVFDAVSAKRCYRDAMPLPDCFQIIEDGSGQDFDPVMAEVFLKIKDQVIEVYKNNQWEEQINENA